ncbi:GNAT family N-acetyltransferase [Thalassovita mangrovi]|uniref:GNAT family N-acetyltransferase n=1 Tax=Thalassovita mangrovi TaxID=2692236 RepID=A0A6L8LNX0_9RHOB|nr:GNAT family N-acetyltransferase [Thalassovita mangrovi]MYM57283.1 GNAT family N-acetyltransferase [Thalassovita mangrovi]
MIRQARPGEEAEIDAFLAGHPETSMFLRSNLAEYGLEDRQHPHAITYYRAPQTGPVEAIFGRANNGFLMCQAPAAGPGLWQDFAATLQGQQVCGMTGDDGQVLAALAALGLSEGAFNLNHAEPLYRLDLAALRAVDVDIRRPVADDVDLLSLWFAQYMRDTGQGGDQADSLRAAITRAVEAISRGKTRLLIEGGVPVAMTGINAEVGDMVQIGGVFTPPDRRGRGHARRVVAAHLAELRDAGINTAILFANNAAAARAYEAIGFERIGAYRVAILKAPRVIGAAA